MKKFFFIGLILLCSGCYSYNFTLHNIKKIEVKPIIGNNPAIGNLTTELLKKELSRDFIITDQNSDLVLSGTVTSFGTTTLIERAIIKIKTKQDTENTIEYHGGGYFSDAMDNFCKKIAKIIKKDLTKD